MYKINDMILYGTEGACKIVDIMKRKVGGKELNYYVLEVVYENGLKIYVPENNEELVGKMKSILSKEEIYEIIEESTNDEAYWIENESDRRAKFGEIIKGGDRKELFRLIKSIYQHKELQKEQGKKIYQADEKVFKEAEKLLYNEFALVLGINPKEVVGFIQKQIEQ